MGQCISTICLGNKSVVIPASECSSDNKELAALKMAADADMSQDEILALIRSTATKPKKDIKGGEGGVDTSLSDADDEIEILEPSTMSAVSTLRSGGRLRSVSTEQPLPTTSNHKNLQEKEGPRTASPRIPTVHINLFFILYVTVAFCKDNNNIALHGWQIHDPSSGEDFLRPSGAVNS